MKRVHGLVALSLFALTACMAETGTGIEGEDKILVDDEAADISGTVEGKAIMPMRGFAVPAVQNAAGANGINYNGGPVMTNTINVYIIWYGNWAGNTTKSIIHDLASNIGGSPYMNINTTYTNAAGTAATKNVVLAGERDDNYSYGTTAAKKKLSDSAIKTIISSHVAAGKFPADANGIYFLITSKDVTATSGFCTQYCGWHTYGTLGGAANLKYSFLGDPARCLSGCAAQQGASPNGNAAADGLASIFAHELVEAGSDPQLNAWFDASGYENADKCAWQFGTTSAAAGGGLKNMTIGARDYYIQQNWVNAQVTVDGALKNGACVTSY